MKESSGCIAQFPDDSKHAGWHLIYETLTTTEKTMPLHGKHRIGGVKPIDVPKSRVVNSTKNKQTGLWLQTAAAGAVMSDRGTSIAVANRISSVWKMADEAAKSLPAFDSVPNDIRLVQDFLRTEVSPEFQLVETLKHGVGVHHAGLSDEVRALMEWLAEAGSLRMLCATTTIAQGINFPVSSVFLAGTGVFDGSKTVDMGPREFWNLAGRAGRIDQDSVGVVGLAEGRDRNTRIEFVSRNTGALVSRLVALLEDLAEQGELASLSEVLWKDSVGGFSLLYCPSLGGRRKILMRFLRDSRATLA